ncbi:NAD(P)H-dependent glycerol-3-phosphate dehydrogenase [Tepidibacter formicigenes]|jgi:glycerol-3-phosphate dehydrogenase (NAD(P)+)|uniref:Glycerol-3-phosphate dehydrogenase [NAD(P)+] n=1 Tax=Tepidibacter formicigenes DSM 15518 TaxID=1123349 RepID=A0A1M6KDY3_9FIRM|nr:NAD(P)H-dependent glycerol-3-phosphate dehydrogenase [Tepidibacter formicigenes]SHJ57149.1 glycerol-3-phosphate dehydrogenase (NAD(P)+) [Tepidibacter formicigenes DSM 15518]
MEKICVLGAGSWGSALAILLSKKGYDVSLWMRNKDQYESMIKTKENVKYLPGVILPNNINLTLDIKEAVENSKIVVLAVASQGVRKVLKSAKEFINSDQIIVNVAKGFEKGTNLRISQVVKEELPYNNYAILSGPSHAEEVSKDMPTTVVVASNDIKIAEYVQDTFINPKFRVYTNPDVIGVELGGTLKNIIAFGAGVCDGLGYGDNTKAALMTRGIREIGRLGVAMGAHGSTFSGLSGIGDLIVTCTSMHSRNRRAGILIGQGKTLEETLKEIKMVVEGITATEVAYNLSKKYGIDMPITKEIYGVLYENKNVNESVINLMLRSKTHEIEEVVLDDKFNF